MNKPVRPQDRLDIENHLDIHEILGIGAAAPHWVQRLPRWLQPLFSRRVWKWAAAALILVLLGFAGWSYFGGNSTVRYTETRTTRGNLTVVVTATGSVQPTNKVDISSELSGTVRTVLVDYNSAVTTGQMLAQLDTVKLEATVASSRAQLASAKAKVQDAQAALGAAERDLARKKKMLPGQAISVQDLDQAEAIYERAVATLASANADVDNAAAALKLNEINLSKASIISPINGVILVRNVDPGQTVASSLQAPVLFSIAEDLKQMELQVDVDEADVGKVTEGQSASFMVDAFPDRKFPASIRTVRFASETIQGVVTYKAVLSVDNSELLLRPGMTATAEIVVTEVKDALLVPNAALRYTPAAATNARSRSILSMLLPGGGRPLFRPSSTQDQIGPNRTVWMLSNGEPTPVKITVGSTDGKLTEVKSGDLKAGQSLVVDQTTTKS